jgi:hypothetical protein
MLTIHAYFSQVTHGLMCVLKLRIKGFKRVVDFLNHRKLSINYDKMMFMNLIINDREENFDTLKIHVCDNNNSCKEIKCKTLL